MNFSKINPFLDYEQSAKVRGNLPNLVIAITGKLFSCIILSIKFVKVNFL